MGRFAVGQSVRRGEDDALLRGRGRFTDDIEAPGQVRAFVLRSPHAHARIRRIDVAAAAGGALLAATHADVAGDGLGGLACQTPVRNSDGSPMVDPLRPLLAGDRVHYVGEPVALVVAESIAAARDAAELIEVDYDPLPAVADTAGALAPGAAAARDEAPDNLCFDWQLGDGEAVERAFAAAAHVVAIEIVNSRLISNALETRGAIGTHDAAADSYTLHTGCQGVHRLRDVLCSDVLKIPPERLRVATADVGGGFGTKYFLYAEQALVLWAARRTGRPVKWIADRGEAFVSDAHARDHVTRAELALDGDGRFLAVCSSVVANLGAWPSAHGPLIPTSLSSPMITGLYDIPAAHVRVRGVFTNTVPIDAYRGAGRPEAAYTIERLVDEAARSLGIDRVELRRRNFIGPRVMPYATALGLEIDSGDFAHVLDVALARVDHAGFRGRREEADARGRRRGLGIATYIECTGGSGAEFGEVRMAADGRVTARVGSQASGQAHATTFAQIVAQELGVDYDMVEVVQGDTATVRDGEGTAGSRSLTVGGTALYTRAREIVGQARGVAAHLLDAPAPDLEFADGTFTVPGSNRSVGIVDAARAAHDPAIAGAMGMEPGLAASGSYTGRAATYPNGCHVCEVEIDEATGVVEVAGYTVVDDFGTLVNPMVVEGQVHGGLAQGLGQALHERCAYDPASGQLLSGSYMDYGLPRADDLPSFDCTVEPTPCATNPLGVKGCGEAGAIGSPPAVINAILDALAPLGVRSIDMPATPETVWRAIRDARRESDGRD